MTDAQQRERRTISRRQVVIIVVLALAGTVVIEADVFVRRLAIQRTEEIVGGCVQLDDPRIDLGRYPVALRALRGHLDDVSFTAAGAELGGVHLTDLRGRVDRVRFRVLGGTDDVRIEGAHVTVRIDEGDVEDLLGSLDLDGTAHIDEGVVELRLEEMPTALRLDIAVADGSVAVSVDGVLEPLLRLDFDVPGVTVHNVEAAAGAVVVDAVADGHPREIACAAADLVRSRLQVVSQLSRLLPS